MGSSAIHQQAQLQRKATEVGAACTWPQRGQNLPAPAGLGNAHGCLYSQGRIDRKREEEKKKNGGGGGQRRHGKGKENGT